MSNKSIIYLLGLLCILILIFTLQQYLPSLFQSKSVYRVNVEQFSSKPFSKITLTRGDKKIELIQENGTWLILGKQANNDLVKTFLSQLFPAYTPDVISESESRYQEFEVSEEASTTVSFDDSQKIYIGKQTASGTYVRINGYPHVYLYKEITSPTLDTDTWYDKTITKIELAKISRLQIKQNNVVTSLVKKDNQWKRESDLKNINTSTVEEALGTFVSFLGQSIATDDEAKSLPFQPSLEVSVEHDSKLDSLLFFSYAQKLYVKHKDSVVVYVVSPGAIDTLSSLPGKVAIVK